MDLYSLLAKGNGDLLVNHLKDTANKCKDYALAIGLDNRLVNACYYAGLLHDIAKAVPKNQLILKEDKHEKVIHSYEGGMFFLHSINMQDIDLKEAIAHSIGFHHAKVTDNQDGLFLEENYSPVYDLVVELLDKFSIDKDFLSLKEDKEESFADFENHYEEYNYFTSNRVVNAYIFIISNVLKMSDIVTSGGRLIDNTKKKIDVSNFTPNNWNKDRLDKQKKIANAIKKDKNNIVTAFCSFGKSVVGFLHCLQSDKKMYWVMPMNSIAISMFDELVNIDELFGNHLSIGLYTANVQRNYNPSKGVAENFSWEESYDIVITNIDNYWSPMLKTSENNRCFSLLERDCVFDEYHNYIDGQSSIFAGFTAIVDARNECKNISSIYLTGTEPYLRTIFGTKDNYIDILETVGVNSFEGNDKSVIIKKGLSSSKLKGSMLVFNNSVRFTQNVAREDNLVCLHSRYTEDDKNDNLRYIMSHNSKSSTEPVSVATTSIISNGVDVSFDNAIINNPNWDLFYQLIGRVNRFNKCDNTPVIQLDMKNLFNETGGFKKEMKSESLSIPNSNVNKTVNLSWAILFRAWRDLLNTLEHNKEYKMSELYQLRKDFIANYNDAFSKFQKSLLRSSEEKLKKLDYKASYKKANNDGGKFNSKNSIRYDGDALNVWCRLDDNDENALINISDINFSSIIRGIDITSESSDIYKLFKRDFKKQGFTGKALRQKCLHSIEQHIKLCRYSSNFAFPLFLLENVRYTYDCKFGLEILKNEE